MAITDKVIEMETKKKGRTALFIVLISVLAALSAVFAVLWIIKAPAVDPPSIEKITVRSSDISKTPSETAEDEYDYMVSPKVDYSITFDLSVKDNGFTAENVNSLLKFTTEPVGMVTTVAEGTGVNNADNVTGYTYNFTVNEAAANHKEFKLIVTSEFSPEINTVLTMKVVNSYTAKFDVKAEENSNHAIYPIKYEKRQVGSVTNEIEIGRGDPIKITAKQTSSNRAYTVTDLPFFGTGLGDMNQEYELEFFQEGEVDAFGVAAKIASGIRSEINPNRFIDEVRVFVADKWEASDNEFKEVIGDSNPSEYLSISLYPDNSDIKYCNKAVRFRPRRDGKATIKLVANSYNNAAVKPTIIFEVEFISSDKLDVISEIYYRDPYTGEKTDEINLFLNNPINFEKPFDFSNYLYVVRGGKDEKPAIPGDVTVSVAESSKSFISQRMEPGMPYAIHLTKKDTLGSGTVTITDKSPNAIVQPKNIKINVCAPITKFTSESDGETIDTNPGRENTVNAVFETEESLGVKNIENSFYARIEVGLPAALINSDADKTVTVVGADKGILVPGMTVSAAKANVFLSGVKLKIGSKVPEGSYTLTFTLCEQGLTVLKDKDGKFTGYEKATKKSVTVTLNVERLAAGFEFKTDYNFGSSTQDKYTELTYDKENKRATLTLAIGTDGLTGFGLKDIIKLYDANGEEVKHSLESSFKAVSVSIRTGSLEDYYRDGKFVLIEKLIDEKTHEANPKYNSPVELKVQLQGNETTSVTLTVEYKYVIDEVQLLGDRNKELQYGAITSADGVRLNNVDNDIPRLIATNGEDIRDSSKLMNGTTDDVILDIAVKINGTPYLLPKVLRPTGNYYYYPFDATDDDLYKEDGSFNWSYFENNSLFMTGSGNILHDSNVYLVRDLFSVSVEKGIDYQNIVLYYTYGKDTLIIGENNGKNTIDIPQHSKLSKYTEYKFIRHFDDMKLYGDSNYSEEGVVNSHGKPYSVLDFASGETYYAYYSGIINLGFKSEKYPDGKFIIEKHNNKDNLGFDYSNLSGHKLACSEVTDSYDKKNNNIQSSVIGQYVLTCASGGENVDLGTLVFSEDIPNGKSVGVKLYVSNTSVGVKSVEFFYDKDCTDEYVPGTLYLNEFDRNTVTLWYKVVYNEFNSHTSFASFSFENNYLSVSQLYVPDFFKAKSLEEASEKSTVKIYENTEFEETIESITVDGKTLTYIGCVTVTADTDNDWSDMSNWPKNGVCTLGINSNGRIISSAEFDVTSLIEDPFVAKFDGKTVIANDETPLDVTLTYDPNGKNEYNLEFEFVQDGIHIDFNNLTFNAVFGEVDGIYNIGYYNNPDNLLLNKKDGYRIRLLGDRVDNGLFEITIYEISEDREFTFRLNITVDVTVETLSAEVKPSTAESGTTLVNNQVLNVETDGTELEYVITPIINGGAANRQPITAPKAEYSIVGKTAADDSAISERVITLLDTEGKIIINNPAHKTVNATVTVTVGGVTMQFDIHVVSGEYSISFDDADISKVREDNFDINATASVYHVTGAKVENASITYSYSDESGVTVTHNSATSPVFGVSGSSGSFKITATYTVGGKVIATADTVITIKIPVKSIIVKDSDNSLISSGSAISLVVGQEQTVSFNVQASSGSSLTPAVTLIEVSKNSTYFTATLQDGVLTIVPVAATVEAQTLTLTCDGVEFTLNITVYDPTVHIAVGVPEISVFNDKVIGIVYSVGAGFTYSVNTLQIDGETYTGNETNKPFKVSATVSDKKDTIVLNKQRLTSDVIGTHTVSVTLTLYRGEEMIKTVTQSVSFSVTALTKDYTPEIAVYKGSGSVTPVGEYYEIDRTTGLTYKFAVSNIPEFAQSRAKVTFAAGDGITLAEQYNEGKISGISASALTTGVTVTVDLFGDGKFTYSATLSNIRIVDSGKIESALYISDTDTFGLAANGSVTGATKITNGAAIDYSADSDRKIVTLVVAYNGAPAAVTKATVDDFTVSSNASLRFISAEIKYGAYYVAKYYAVATGDVVIGVHTSVLEGTVYSATPIAVSFTATAPEFNVSGNDTVTLDPGANKVITVTKANGFVGDVEYSATAASNILQVTKADNAFTVTAARGVGGGEAKLLIVARVTSGTYKGEIFTKEITVTVNSYPEPVIKVTAAAKLNGTATELDLSTLFAMSWDDSKDREFAYTVTFTDPERGSIVKAAGERFGKYVTDGSGYVTTFDYEVAITGGHYTGKTYSGSITVTVAPAASEANFTVAGGVNKDNVYYVSLKDELTLGATVSGINSADLKVTHLIESGADLGSISGNKFVPAVAATAPANSNVIIKTTVRIIGGDYAGTEYSKTTNVVVTWLKLAQNQTLSATAGGELITANKFVNNNGAIVGATFDYTGSDAIFTINNGTVKVSPDANYGTSATSAKLCVKYVNDGITYYGEFNVAIQPLVVPVFNAAQKVSDYKYELGSNVTNGVSYKASVVSGGEFIDELPNNYKTYSANTQFTFTPKTDTLGGNVVIEFTMLVSGGAYSGGIYDNTTYTQTVTFTVNGIGEPELNLKLSDDGDEILPEVVIKNTTNKLAANYSYYIVSGSGITFTEGGKFTLDKTYEPQTATVLVVASITDAPYAGTVITNTIPVSVGALPLPDPELTAEVVGNKIVATVSNGTATSVTYEVAESDKQYITIDENGVFTLKDSTYNGNITVTVKATVESKTLTKTVTIAVVKAPVPAEISLSTVNSEYVGTVTFGGSGYEVVGVELKEYSPYITLYNKVNYKLIPTYESYTVNIVLTYKVTADCSFTGKVYTKEYTGVTVAALLEPELAAEVVGNKIVATLSYGTATSVTYEVAESDKQYLTVSTDGVITIADGAPDKEITVTVKAVVGSKTLTEEVKVTVVAAPVPAEISLGTVNSEYVGTVTFGGSGYEVVGVALKEYSPYITLYNKVNYKLVPTYEDYTVTIVLTYKVTAECSFTGNIYTKEYANVKIDALLENKLTAEVEGNKIVTSVLHGTATGITYTAVPSGKITIGNDGTFGITDITYHGNVQVTVTATVNGQAVTIDGAPLTATVQISVTAAPVPGDITLGTVNDKYEGTITFGGEGYEIVSVALAEPSANITLYDNEEYDYKLVPTYEDYTVNILLIYKVTAECSFTGEIYTKEYKNVKIDALLENKLTAVVEGNKIVASVSHGTAEFKYTVADSDKQYISIDDYGVFTVTDPTYSGTINVTVTATLEGGKTLTETVPVVVEAEETGGEDSNNGDDTQAA